MRFSPLALVTPPPWPPLLPQVHRLLLYTFKRSPKERCVWSPRRVVFESPSQDTIKGWQAHITAGEAGGWGRALSTFALLPHALKPAPGQHHEAVSSGRCPALALALYWRCAPPDMLLSYPPARTHARTHPVQASSPAPPAAQRSCW